MEFMHDTLATGQSIRVLTILDAYTRECLGLIAQARFTGGEVAAHLGRMAAERQAPTTIAVDNVLSARGWSGERAQHPSGVSESHLAMQQATAGTGPVVFRVWKQTPLPIIHTGSAPLRGRPSPFSIQRGVPAEGPRIIYGVAVAPTARTREIEPLGRACS